MTACKVCGGETRIHLSQMFDDRYGYPRCFDILVCKSCDTFQLFPQLAKKDIADLYTHYYPRQQIDPRKIRDNFRPESGIASTVTRWFSGNHRVHYNLPQKGGGKKVLEIGCGDGKSLLQLQAMGYDVYGVEADENIKKVRDEIGLPIHIGIIEEIDFKSEKFDYIIANQLIEHVIDLDSFFEKCGMILKEGGSIIFSTPNAGSAYLKAFGKKWINWHIPYHQQIFNKKSIAFFAKKHGFFMQNIYTVTPTAWTLHQLTAMGHNQPLGKKNPYWNKNITTIKDSILKTEPSVSKKILIATKHWVFTVLVFSISICNKIIDLPEQGDCLIVILKK